MTTTLSESLKSSPEGSKIVVASPEVITQTVSHFLPRQNGAIPGSNQTGNATGIARQMIRSASDNFDYKLLQLANGIRVLLISDPSYKDLPPPDTTLKPPRPSRTSRTESSSSSCHNMEEDYDEDEEEGYEGEEGFESGSEGDDEVDGANGEKGAAIAVAVHVGSFQDPADFPGMAHMLEHLMSMGCEAFPEENHLDDFLNSRGGDQNAFTEVEHTVYEIRVQRSFLQETIDLVAAMFKAPLLRQSSIDREIKPIDSEFIEASACDETRVEMLLSHLSNPTALFHKFLWGNTESLITSPRARGLDTREAVLKWYAEQYRSDRLVFVIQSQESMENLLGWSRVFEAIPRSPGALPEPSSPAPEALPFEGNPGFRKFYIVETSEVGSHLILSWITPPVVKDYMKGPIDFLATLIGYEGRESLLSELKRQNLAVQLITNSQPFTVKINHHYSVFQIEIELTEFGARNLDRIVELTGEYLAVLRNAGTQEYFFKENQTIALASFNNACEREALQNAERLAQNILFYPVEHTLTGNALFYHYAPADIDRMLDQFRLENANFMLATRDFRPDIPVQQEPWMKTNYQELDVPAAWIAGAPTGKSEVFFYPQPNRFIATDFQLISGILPEDSKERNWGPIPEKILDRKYERIQAWYKPDFEYSLPKAKVYFHLLSPAIEGTVRDETLCDILSEMLLFELNEYCYDAELAQLSFAMSRTFNGIQLPVSGFSHKLPDLIFLIFERILNFEVAEDRLETIKKTVLKDYTNKYFDQHKYATALRLKTLLEHFSTLSDRSRIVEKVTVDDLADYKRRLLGSLSVEMLIQGNITLEQSEAIVKQIAGLLQLDEKIEGEYRKENFRILELPAGKTKIRRLGLNPKSEMNHVVCYFQLGEFDFRSFACLSLFIDIAEELCFNYLRTKEGLGYSVSVQLNDTFGILGFNTQVTSPAAKFDCDLTEAKIGEFVFDVTRKVFREEMDEQKYEEHLESLIRRKKEKDVSLDEEVGRNMGEIMSFNYHFTRREREIAELMALKGNRKRFLDWMQEKVWKDPAEVRQLNIEIVGYGEHALKTVADVEGKPVVLGELLAAGASVSDGDTVREVCLMAAEVCKDPSVFIDDFEAFKAGREYFERQPPTSSLQ